MANQTLSPPTSKHHVAINFMVQSALAATQSGDWVAAQSKAVAFLKGKGWPDEVIHQCITAYPFDPAQRVANLARAYGKQGWREWAEQWATPEEIAHVIQSAPPALAIAPSYPGAMSQPAPPPHITAPPPTPVNATPATTPLFARGQAIEEGLRAFGLNVSLIPEQSSDAGLRCDRLVFSKPLEMPFSAPQKFLSEALSNAGIDPEAGVIFRRLPKNLFEMQIPRPRNEWESAHLLKFLCTDPKGGAIFSSKRTPEDKLVAFGSHLKAIHNPLPQNAPQLPGLVDLNGEVYWLDGSSHILIGGGSKGGKSTFIKTMLQDLMLLYPPEWAKFSLFDFKEGVTLTPYLDTDWNWGSDICTDPNKAETYWKDLKSEADFRSAAIRDAGVENLSEYNALHPGAPIPWLYVIMDEIGNYKSQVGESADEWLQLCMSQWRAWGIICIGSTQYPSAKHALGPSTRTNFQTKVLFACDEPCAKLVLGDSDRHAIEATRLVPPGDCLVKAGGQYIRGQALYMAPPVAKTFLAAHSNANKLNPFHADMLGAA